MENELILKTKGVDQVTKKKGVKVYINKPDKRFDWAENYPEIREIIEDDTSKVQQAVDNLVKELTTQKKIDENIDE